MRRQCELLRLSRSGLYYEPEPTSLEQLALMRRIDELHLKYPFYGSRKLSRCASQGGIRGESQAHPAAHAPDGHGGHSSEAHDERAAPRACRVPVPPARPHDFPSESGLGDRHHLHPDEGGLYVPRRYHRLVLAASPVVAIVEHARFKLLRGGARRGPCALRSAGDLQHGPRRAIHGGRFHQGRFAIEASRSAWTARAAASTTSSSSDCGGP